MPNATFARFVKYSVTNTYMRFKTANNIVVILQSASLSSQGIGVDLNVGRPPVVI
jgi:hypothetical protein